MNWKRRRADPVLYDPSSIWRGASISFDLQIKVAQLNAPNPHKSRREKIASCDKNRDQNQIFESRLCALGSRKVEPVTLEFINMGGGGTSLQG